MNLAHPAWLLVWIAVPIFVCCALLFGRHKNQRWTGFVAKRLKGKLMKHHHPLPRRLALAALLTSIVILALVMARPQGDEGVKTEKTEGKNIMIALDLSRSMRAQDVKPDRLAQAKIVIYELLDSLKSDRVGLIAFAGTPYLSAPLTIDHAAVKETVEQMDETWLPKGGSDIAAAVQLASETLKKTGQKNNALIVISDGEEHEGDLDAIIADAEKAGVTIIAVGVGTEDGAYVPHPDFPDGMVDEEGNRVLSRLQPKVLQKLATETGGRYVVAGLGSDIPGLVKGSIEGLDAFEMEGKQTKIVIEFFQWPLLPAILFLMAAIVAGTRWKGLAASSTLAFLLSFPQLKADLTSDANRAFSEKKYEQARDHFKALADDKDNSNTASRYRLGQGLAAYEAQDFREARSAYSAALLAEDPEVKAEAHNGMGNTLFQLGWLGLSGSRYPAGQETPNMEQFDELVQKHLKRMVEAKLPESGESNEFIRLDSIILNWSDAIRHYRSASHLTSAVRNEKLTLIYLKRLKELLDEEQQEAEKELTQMEQQQAGPGQKPKHQGDKGDGDKEGEGKGEKDEQKEEDGESEPKENEDDKDGDGESERDPNETPEEHAARVLSENADIQKGAQTPATRDFRNPKKDW